MPKQPAAKPSAQFISRSSAAAFDLLVDWNVEQSRWDDALSYAEAGRNRTFLDQVRAAGIDPRQSLRGTPQEHLLGDEKRILAEYHSAQSEAMKRLETASDGKTNTRSGSDTAELMRKLTDLRQRYATVQTAIRDASPFYREILLSDREPQTWPLVQYRVLSSQSVMVFYYLGQTGGHLFLIDGRTPDHPEVLHYPLAVSADQSSRLGVPTGPAHPASRRAIGPAIHRLNRSATAEQSSPRTRNAGRSSAPNTRSAPPSKR